MLHDGGSLLGGALVSQELSCKMQEVGKVVGRWWKDVGKMLVSAMQLISAEALPCFKLILLMLHKNMVLLDLKSFSSE